MEISGKIITVLPLQSGTSKNGNVWQKQEFVLQTEGQYPKKMCYQLFGEDKIKMFGVQVGNDVDVKFDIDANEWNGKWFNSVNAWNVVLRNPKNYAQSPTEQVPQSVPFDNNQGQDDLPF